MTAPHGIDVETLQERIRTIKDYCDAINVTDNPRGIPALSNVACAYFVIKEGAEPVLQMNGRDRNRILIQSDLYGAYALGVRNVLFITGDSVLMGTQPLSKMVFDVDSTQALDLARLLMEGFDLGGEEIVGSPSFFLGATFNPNAQPYEIQVKRIQEKIKGGAQFFQTQALYDLERFATLMDDVREMDTWTLAGIIPLRNSEMAETMNKKVPGIRVPEEMIFRLRDAEDGLEEEERETASRKVGLEIALETIEGVKRIDGVSGIHLMGIGWEESIPELVKKAGLVPRPSRG